MNKKDVTFTEMITLLNQGWTLFRYNAEFRAEMDSPDKKKRIRIDPQLVDKAIHSGDLCPNHTWSSLRNADAYRLPTMQNECNSNATRMQNGCNSQEKAKPFA